MASNPMETHNAKKIFAILREEIHDDGGETMHGSMLVTLAVLAITVTAITGCKKEPAQKTETAQSSPSPAVAPPATGEMTGESLFKQFCAPCHPDGGNVINPNKTLHAAVLAQYGITKAEDMIRVMRNPGPGMRRFEQATISDKDAGLIWEYLATTF